MSGVTVAHDDEIDLRRVRAGLGKRLASGGQRDVAERLVLGRDPPLPDPGSLANPLVGRVDVAGQVVVRHHGRGNVRPEPRDPDPRPGRRADHRSTANVSVPRAASLPSTVAVALPRPTGPRIASISHVRVSVSPGETTRLNRQSSIPAKNAILPRFCLLDEHCDRAGLGHRLDDEHARASRAVRESDPGTTSRPHARASWRRPSGPARARSPRRAGGTGPGAGGCARSRPCRRDVAGITPAIPPPAARAWPHDHDGRSTWRYRPACPTRARSPRTNTRARP